jgi:rhodanese-related sulfurtransferase
MHPRFAHRLLPLLTVAVATLSSPAASQAADPSSLRRLISMRFPGLDWLGTADLAEWLANESAPAPTLLDAREEAEYVVSHIEGAVRIDPDAKGTDLPTLESDAPVVVYCSVGYRSGAIARRLEKSGHTRVFNLTGGIFAWANEGRPVYRGQERVEEVHPFDSTWSRYLDPALRAEK